ncbi:hypothetical protein LTR85_009106 [Meristemomyces frigidus]|nr:hypothetical protein LTR85_009106 [Meristemomyces frigidus]
MNFGFSPGDIASLIILSKKAYDGWRSAGTEYADISQTLSSFKILLKHLRHRSNDDQSNGGLRDKREELEDILQGCRSAVVELADVSRRYRKLTHFDRLRLGTKDVSKPKERLVRHMGMLTPFIFMVEVESIGKDIRSLPHTISQIPNIIQSALAVAFGSMIDSRAEDARSARSSLLTTYGDDDKQAYKELRRNLRGLGVKDADIRTHRPQLVEFVRSVLSEGTELDETIAGTRAQAPAHITGSVPRCADSLSESAVGSRCLHATATGTEAVAHDEKQGRYQAYVESDQKADDADAGVVNGPIDGPLIESTAMVNCMGPESEAEAEEVSTALTGSAKLDRPCEQSADTVDEDDTSASPMAYASSSDTRSHYSDDVAAATESECEHVDLGPASDKSGREIDAKPIPEPLPSFPGQKTSDAHAVLGDVATLLGRSNEGTGASMRAQNPAWSEEHATPAPSPLNLRRLLGYEPLDVAKERRLTVQMPLPTGWSIYVDRIAQFLDRRAPLNGRRFHASLPKAPNGKIETPVLCLHGFPTASNFAQEQDGKAGFESCACEVLQWTPELQQWNPDFLDNLRRLMQDTVIAAPVHNDAKSFSRSSATHAGRSNAPFDKVHREARPPVPRKRQHRPKSSGSHRVRFHLSSTSSSDSEDNDCQPPPNPPRHRPTARGSPEQYKSAQDFSETDRSEESASSETGRPEPLPMHGGQRTFTFGQAGQPSSTQESCDAFAEFMRNPGLPRNDAPSVTEPEVFEKPLLVSLEDIYSGSTKRMKVEYITYDRRTYKMGRAWKIFPVPIQQGVKPGTKIK